MAVSSGPSRWTRPLAFLFLLLVAFPATALPYDVLSIPPAPNQFYAPTQIAFDATGALYLMDDQPGFRRLLKRDAGGNWSVLAEEGPNPGQVLSPIRKLAASPGGDLFLLDGAAKILHRQAVTGEWSVLEPLGATGHPTLYPAALQTDPSGQLHVLFTHPSRLVKQSLSGDWSEISLIRASSPVRGTTVTAENLFFDGSGKLYLLDGSHVYTQNAEGRWVVRHTLTNSDLYRNEFYQSGAFGSGGALYLQRLFSLMPGIGMDLDRVILPPEGQNDPAQVSVLPLDQDFTPFAEPASDAQGRVYIAAPHDNLNSNSSFPAAPEEQRRARVMRVEGTSFVTFAESEAPQPGQLLQPRSLAISPAGEVYVADTAHHRIAKRDSRGVWSVLSSPSFPELVCVDSNGVLYLGTWDRGATYRRDASGTWTELPPQTFLPCSRYGKGYTNAQGQYTYPSATDSRGNTYFLSYQKSTELVRRDPQGNETLVAGFGTQLGLVHGDTRLLLVDRQDRLWVLSEAYQSGDTAIQRLETNGSWTLIASAGIAVGQIRSIKSAVLDNRGNLFVSDATRLQMRDAQGHWTVLQENFSPADLAVGPEGSLYVLDDLNSQLLRFNIAALAFGDVNGDGSFLLTDVLAALRIVVFQQLPTAQQIAAGDVNGDGVLTLADVSGLLRKFVGLPG